MGKRAGKGGDRQQIGVVKERGRGQEEFQVDDRCKGVTQALDK